LNRYRCLLLFGPPGVGKGTQGARLGLRPDMIHLATGDLFRALDPGSHLGRKFVEYSSRGELVPDDLTIQVWRDHVHRLMDAGSFDPSRQILVLDGMPRSTRQAEMLTEVIEPLCVLHLFAKDMDTMVQRMKLRAEKEGRHDDAEESVIRRRFEVYLQETSPVLRCYPTELVVDIDAIGTVEQVSERIDRVLEQFCGSPR